MRLRFLEVEENVLNKIEYSAAQWPSSDVPATMSQKTRRVYDILAEVYPLSTMLFHSVAHRKALSLSGIKDGMKVLEVATGSGEMFQRLVRANPRGRTIGVDLSPNMAARTQRNARREFPGSSAHCQAVDARQMPFRDKAFDAVVCCYLLELLPAEDISKTVAEFNRVLKTNGQLTLILIGQNANVFNAMYQVATRVAPAFWGRQVEQRLPEVIRANDFKIVRDHTVRQIFYPSRVLIARK